MTTKYPNVSINGGTAFPCYFEVDGIEDRTVYSVRFETDDPIEHGQLIRYEANQYDLDLVATLTLTEGVAVEFRFFIYVRPEVDLFGSSIRLMDVTLVGNGPLLKPT